MRQSAFGKTAAGAHIAKVLPASISSVIVFLVVGIWHGANSKYIAFGLWNGLIIMISILCKPVFDRMREALRIRAESFYWRVFRIVRTFILVLVGYYFDIAPSFTGAMDMMKRSLMDLHPGTDQERLPDPDGWHAGDLCCQYIWRKAPDRYAGRAFGTKELCTALYHDSAGNSGNPVLGHLWPGI